MKRYDKIKQKEVDQVLQELGNHLTKLRKKSGYKSHENFAFEIGIGRSQYGRYENGSDIRLSSLIKLVKAFDMSLEEFFKDFD